ncbi:para-nitrobenzyl esterase [Frondihabitans sp. PhB188]|uniref:carboxylesterase/lipase family protein n=1 Tax=Frondihabitans sp. PhB188 TaxID=2485200 RepID=UPI000F47F3DE|nr:carboxylesterase family protein [Frondihabitans sp. PhB188]ROQ41576.1 para-nitrobenzyl esterase [Frondihabitans sp. PhB188]
MTLVQSTVVTTASGRVQGVVQTPHSVAFLGIPFAEAPVGELRFTAPRRRASWDGVRPAVEYGATAQREPFGPFVTIPEPSIPGADTLNVNVFTPAPGDTEANLPVFVWIHGGGYFAGSPASPWYDGRSFNRDGVVTVTVSYRLGFQGFGCVDGGGFNRGLLDQLAALEWVQENIRQFGGDPAKVTIGGQSAGGGSVLALLASPLRGDLFRAVISHSGAAGDLSADAAEPIARAYADSLGIAPTLEAWSTIPEERITATERDFNHVGDTVLEADAPPVSAADLVAGLADGSTSGRTGLAWAPVIDGEVLAGPMDAGLAQNAAVPLLLGTTRNEFSAPGGRVDVADVRRDLEAAGVSDGAIRAFEAEVARVGADRAESQLVTSALFRTAVPRIATARQTADPAARTWAYDFAGRRFEADPSGHCSDIPFAWDLLDAEGVPVVLGDTPSQALADRMHADWVGFIADGAAPWHPATADRLPTRSYVNEGHVDSDEVYAFEQGLFAAARRA